MGSPVSSIVANLFMDNFEENALKEAGELRPQVWDRYGDDVFSICKKKKNVERFLQYLNSRDQNIHFTLELEKNGARIAVFRRSGTKNCGGKNKDRGTSENDAQCSGFSVRFTPSGKH